MEEELQLSHVHSNVETSGVSAIYSGKARASIEPRSFKRGNDTRKTESLLRSKGFN